MPIVWLAHTVATQGSPGTSPSGRGVLPRARCCPSSGPKGTIHLTASCTLTLCPTYQMVGPYLNDGQMSSEDPNIHLASASTTADCQEEFRSALTRGLGIMISNVTTTTTLAVLLPVFATCICHTCQTPKSPQLKQMTSHTKISFSYFYIFPSFVLFFFFLVVTNSSRSDKRRLQILKKCKL